MKYSYLLTAKITPDFKSVTFTCRGRATQFSACYTQYWCLIMASTKLMYYVYARSFFASKFSKEI